MLYVQNLFIFLVVVSGCVSFFFAIHKNIFLLKTADNVIKVKIIKYLGLKFQNESNLILVSEWNKKKRWTFISSHIAFCKVLEQFFVINIYIQYPLRAFTYITHLFANPKKNWLSNHNKLMKKKRNRKKNWPNNHTKLMVSKPNKKALPFTIYFWCLINNMIHSHFHRLINIKYFAKLDRIT